MKTPILLFFVLAWAGLTLPQISAQQPGSPQRVQLSGWIVNHEGMGEANLAITVRAMIDGTEQAMLLQTDDEGHFGSEVPPAEWHIDVDADDLLSRGYSRRPVHSIDPSIEEAVVLNIIPNRPLMNVGLSALGEIVVGLNYDMPASRDLQVRRAYSVQASSNLEDWFEIGTSSSIRSVAELLDPGAALYSTRFYRAVLVESTFISVDEYYEQMEALDQFMSGIVRDGITLEEIETLRNIQWVLKDTLEGIIANGGIPTAELINEFREQVDAIDAKLANSPLVVAIEGVLVEVEVSEAMRVLAEEYGRLGLVSLSDYDRLPGIDPEDLIGHETFAQYLDSRQVGIHTGIPVFQALSPYGNFTLIHALVVKYGGILLEQTTDSDNDGIAEINYLMFRRLINGTELAFREGLRLIEDIVELNPIPWTAINGPSITGDAITEVLVAISHLDDELRSQTEALVASKTMEEVFKNQMLNEINREVYEIYSGNVDALRARVRPPSIELDIIPSQAISFPSSPATRNELANLIDAVLSWNLAIGDSLNSYLDGLTVADRLKSEFTGMLLQKLNGYRDQLSVEGLYEGIYDRMEDLIRREPVAFDVRGVGRVVSDQELDTIVNSLPTGIDDLLLFPGINHVLTREDLEALHPASEWSTLTRVNLSGPAVSTSDRLSIFGLRVELTDLLLQAFGEQVVTEGAIDIDAYFRALVMDDVLEQRFDATIGLVDLVMAEVSGLNLDPGQGISSDEYQSLNQFLLNTKHGIEDFMIPELNGAGYQARALVTAMLQTSFDRLVAQVDSLLSRGLVRIDIEGLEYRVDAMEIGRLLDSLAQRISVIPPHGSPTRRHYARLRGISEEMLLGLKDPSDQARLRTIVLGSRIGPRTPGIDSRPDDLEVFFVLVPEVLESFGNAILSGGRVDVSLVQANLLQDVYVPVAGGTTLWGVYRQIVEAEIGNGLVGLSTLDFGQWSHHVQAEQIIISTMRRLVERVAPLIREVTQSEINMLERDTQWGRYLGSRQYSTSLRDLWSSYNSRRNVSTVSLTMADGNVIEVPLWSIRNIPRFPYNENYDRELFVGLDDSDFEGTAAPSNGISYNPDGILDAGLLNGFNRDRLVINVVTRHYEQLAQIPVLYREDLFTDSGVAVEILRRLIKGVDLLHQQVLAEVRQRTDEAVQQLRAIEEDPMTIAVVKNIYGAVAEFRGEIMEYLTELTSRHEREDVLEMEEGVSAIYEDVIDEMIQYLRENRLVVLIDDAEIEVPVQEITDRLLGLLNARFPGEDIGAHHFASLFGISVEDLRSYNKLEEFLGIQIVALPRNSQYVEILSKLSEIGLMELATDSMVRYADQVVDVTVGTVDMVRLMELLTDQELAVERANARATDLVNVAIGTLQSVEEPNTLAGIQKIATVFNEAKLNLVNTLNDVASGFSEEMLNEVQTHLTADYLRLVATRDALVIGHPTAFQTTDGSDFAVNLGEIEGNVVDEIVELLAGMEEPIPEEIPVDIPVGLPPGRLVADEILWGPPIRYPLPEKFDPQDTLTRFGFHLLMARLVHRYSDFVTENGSFSLERFLLELGRTDLERATESFERLGEEALSGLENLVPANTEPVRLDQVTVVHAYLDDTRERFLTVLTNYLGDQTRFYEVIDIGNLAWAAVMDRYEALLFSRHLTVTLNGNDVTLDVQALMAILEEEYDKGHTVLLDSYAEGGESRWSYDLYRVLYTHYWWDSVGMPQVGASLSGTEVDSPPVEDPLYPFDLGGLNSIPGINADDLAGLDVESKDSVQLSLIDPKELLKGLLNMRVFAPGSSVQTLGRGVSSDSLSAPSPPGFKESGLVVIDWVPGFRDLSERDILFRVIPKIFEDFYEDLIDADGEIDLDKLLDLLEDGQIGN